MKSHIYNTDCLVGMGQYPDDYFDLAVVDPPYGINAPNMPMGSKQATGHISTAQKIKKGRLNSGGGHFANKPLTTLDCNWDQARPGNEYFKELFRISKNQVIFGGNYFTDNLPVSRCWICWDKKQPWDNFSQFEMAWTSFDMPSKMVRISNRGGNNDKSRIHPTQKPVPLYNWTFEKFMPEGGKVIDTHLGSGSSRISADLRLNITELVGFETSELFFKWHQIRWDEYKKTAPVFG